MLWKERKRPTCLALAAIAASGFVYGMTYFFVVITDEFRYLYWLIFSVIFVAAALAFETDALRWKRSVAFLLLPLLAIWTAEHGFRMIWHTEDIAPSMATNY